jgi:hypothetical protein
MNSLDPKIDARTIKSSVDLSRNQAPYSFDSQFEMLRQAKIGSPILVKSPQGEPSFWMVPLLVGEMACGFAAVDLRGQVSRMGIFGGGAKDRAAWVKAEFFNTPPDNALAEIAEKYPGFQLSKPEFSYDGSPARWGWMVLATREGVLPATIMITPGGWFITGPPAAGDAERGAV